MDKWVAERGSRKKSTGFLYKYLRSLKNKFIVYSIKQNNIMQARVCKEKTFVLHPMNSEYKYHAKYTI